MNRLKIYFFVFFFLAGGFLFVHDLCAVDEVPALIAKLENEKKRLIVLKDFLEDATEPELPEAEQQKILQEPITQTPEVEAELERDDEEGDEPVDLSNVDVQQEVTGDILVTLDSALPVNTQQELDKNDPAAKS